jgi:hypothetical protein
MQGCVAKSDHKPKPKLGLGYMVGGEAKRSLFDIVHATAWLLPPLM